MAETAIGIRKAKDFSRSKPRYVVGEFSGHFTDFIGEEFYPADIKPIEGHYLIIHYSPLGGGMDGWDSEEEFVGIAHTKKELSKKTLKCALDYAKYLGAKRNLPVINITRRYREGNLVQVASQSEDELA